MGIFRGDLPIAVIEHDFECIPASFAKMSDFCSVGVGDRMPIFIEEGIGKIPVVDPTDIQLGRFAIAIEDRVQTQTCVLV